MNKHIKFTIQQDEDKVPDKIFWEASDNPNEGLEETKGIMVAVWDQYNHGTLVLPLWTKDMEVFDMKRFCIEILGSVAEVLEKATGDVEMVQKIDQLGHELSQKVMQEMKAAQEGN